MLNAPAEQVWGGSHWTTRHLTPDVGFIGGVTPHRTLERCDLLCELRKRKLFTKGNSDMHMIPLIIHPVVGAIGYSFMYLLGGGGIFGAIVIFIIFKLFGK